LSLLLQVPAVILNAVKDREEFHSPQPFEPFNPHRPAVVIGSWDESAPRVQPATKRPRPAQSPKGKATDLLAFVLLWHLFFRVFRPKIACQAPKAPKRNIISQIALASLPLPIRYN
jgi:hypothetical protein